MSHSQISSSQLEGNFTMFGSNQASLSIGLQQPQQTSFNSQATTFLAKCSSLSMSKPTSSPQLSKSQQCLNGRGKSITDNKKSSQSTSQKDLLIMPQCLIPLNTNGQDQGSYSSNSQSTTLDNFLMKSKQPSSTTILIEKEWFQTKLNNIESQIQALEKQSNQGQEEISCHLNNMLKKVNEIDVWHQELTSVNEERHLEVMQNNAQAQVIKTLSNNVQEITCSLQVLLKKIEEEDDAPAGKNKISKQKKMLRKNSQFEKAMQNMIQDKTVLKLKHKNDAAIDDSWFCDEL
nr:unnamed protein product [Naegleria fowleri]